MKKIVIIAVLLLIFMSYLPVQGQEIKSIHVFVALCDRVHQGIISSNPRLENGEDLRSNLYWGAYYGIKSYFKRSPDWRLIKSIRTLSDEVLERVIFRHRRGSYYLIADAYRGSQIKKAVIDFLSAAAGLRSITVRIDLNNHTVIMPAGSGSGLVCYIGHNGLMDFSLASYPRGINRNEKKVIILACKSKSYFKEALEEAGAYPLLWTTGLMAPEAYTLKAALDGWTNRESDNEIQRRAAEAYHRYQNCGLRAALRLITTGW